LSRFWLRSWPARRACFLTGRGASGGGGGGGGFASATTPCVSFCFAAGWLTNGSEPLPLRIRVGFELDAQAVAMGPLKLALALVGGACLDFERLQPFHYLLSCSVLCVLDRRWCFLAPLGGGGGDPSLVASI
jgi:hypothetical protein